MWYAQYFDEDRIMGTISSGVGLVSGIDIEGLVGQLMEIESRPREQVKQRLETSVKEQEALMKVQALVMSLQISASNFNKDFVFSQKAANSSNEDVMTASATRFAEEGAYAFTVKRLASNHSFISRKSYANKNSNVGNGAISFEMGQGQLVRATNLNFINGQNGFQRGAIRVIDRAGNSADIDLAGAITMQDVIDTINSETGVNIRAGVSGDGLLIEDISGGTGALTIADIGAGTTAEDLGITNDAASSAADDRIVGRDIIYMTENTLLTDLNDGNGVRGIDTSLADIRITPSFGPAMEIDLKSTMTQTIGDPSQSTLLRSLNHGAGIRMGQFRITDQNGSFIEIDLNELGENATVAQLESFIETKAADNGMSLNVKFANQDHITIEDQSEAVPDPNDPNNTSRRSHFIIEDMDGGHAAADLGITADTISSTIEGEKVWFMESVGDVINAVNNHWTNRMGHIVMGIDAEGNGLTLADNSGPSGTPVIEVLNDSRLAEDLGLVGAEASGNTLSGRRLVSGLNTVLLSSLNGGTGGDPDAEDYGQNRISGGEQLFIKDRSMDAAIEVDLTGVNTVQDLINRINDAGTGIQAEINRVGNGIVLRDGSGGTGELAISGSLADKLNLTTTGAASEVDSGNLQLQYINEAAKLDDLRQGQGVFRGTFTITDGTGKRSTINISDRMNTLEDVIDRINRGGSSVRARINDTGDGLLLYDTAENPSQAFTVEEFGGGSTAHDLGILGTAERNDSGRFQLDGSFEFRMDVTSGDTLNDIVNYVNDANIGVRASMIYDGTGYRLNFESQVQGSKGTVYLDGGGTSLETQTVSNGQDAMVFLGSADRAHPVLITSSDNTIDDMIDGVTLDLNAVGDEPVIINIEKDTENIKKYMNNFVEAYNSLMDEISKVTKFNADTLDRGILFSDYTVNNVKSTVQSMILHAAPNMETFNRLSDIGITFAPLGTETVTDENGETIQTVVSNTPKLQFDEARFMEAFQTDQDAVSELFTKKDVGLGHYIAELLDDLAGTSDSTIQNRLESMQSRQQLYQSRIENLNELLSSKENRLYNQFYAMEQALASMQSQQSALSSLAGSASSLASASSSLASIG